MSTATHHVQHIANSEAACDRLTLQNLYLLAISNAEGHNVAIESVQYL